MSPGSRLPDFRRRTHFRRPPSLARMARFLERLPAVRPILRLPSPLTTEGHPGRPTQLQAIQQLASGAVLVSVFLSRRRPTEVGQCSSGRICTRRRMQAEHGKGPYPHRRGSQIKRSRWSLRLPRMVGRLHDIRDAVAIRSSWARWTEEGIGAPAIRSQLDELGWQAYVDLVQREASPPPLRVAINPGPMPGAISGQLEIPIPINHIQDRRSHPLLASPLVPDSSPLLQLVLQRPFADGFGQTRSAVTCTFGWRRWDSNPRTS